MEQRLLKSVPEEFMQHAHHWLILHGRYTCVAKTQMRRMPSVFDLCKFSGSPRYVE